MGPEKSLDVATGSGVLEVTRLQPAGSAEMDGAEFAAAVSAGGTAQRRFGEALGGAA